MNKDSKNINIQAIRFSLGLKIIIISWALYSAITTDETSVSIFYLVVSILFAGLFVFQLDYYRKKKAGKGK